METQNGQGQEEWGQEAQDAGRNARGVIPPPRGGVQLPARIMRQGAAQNRKTQICIWGEEGSLNFFWDCLSYLCRASTIINHVMKVEQEVQQATKTQTRFDMWVTDRYVDAILGKMGPGQARYGWYFRCHIPFLQRTGMHGPPMATPPDVQVPPPTIASGGAPLVVGTLNINGLQHKKSDLRVLFAANQM
jgi:hypothetical protein